LGERRNIVIAGAGIGGLTAALALAGRGFPTIVCERSDRLSEVGAGIQLSPNVSNVLAGLGIGNPFGHQRPVAEQRLLRRHAAPLWPPLACDGTLRIAAGARRRGDRASGD
jgi:2-polyprenyl-6-methoxyphenol hydroxylase-like FAD-dependent oxidoreductase